MRRALLATGVVLGTLGPWSEGVAAPPDDPGRPLVFVSNRDGNWEIYRARSDGSNLRRLTRHPGRDAEPTWAPDGSQIAFVRHVGDDPEIHVMHADGTGIRRITRMVGEDLSPAWSPDGSLLAFTSDNRGRHISTISYEGERGSDWLQELYVMRPDGSGRRRLLSERTIDFAHPAWSPDGTRIAVAAYDVDGVSTGIWTVDVRTGLVRKLFHDHAFIHELAWSPDGTMLAFRMDRRGGSQIHLFDFEAWTRRQLTAGPASAVRPAWSRDSRHVIYTSDLDGARYGGTDAAVSVQCAAVHDRVDENIVEVCAAGPLPSEIWSIGVDGRGARRLFAHPADAADPEPRP